MLQIKHMEFPGENGLDNMRLVLRHLKNMNLITNVHERVSSKFEHTSYAIRIRPTNKHYGGMHKNHERFITIYHPVDTELPLRLNNIFSTFTYTYETTGEGGQVIYLGSFLKEAGLHAYFKRGDVLQYRVSDNYQSYAKNKFILTTAAPEFVQTTLETSSVNSIDSVYRGRGVISSIYSYEISEIVFARELFLKIKDYESKHTEIEFLKYFHANFVAFDGNRLLNL